MVDRRLVGMLFALLVIPSLVDNYRAQVARVLRMASYPELLDRLRDAAGPEAPPSSPAATAGPSVRAQRKNAGP